jgi:hypothetical protein
VKIEFSKNGNRREKKRDNSMDSASNKQENLPSQSSGYRMKSHDIGYKFIPKTASTSIKYLLFEIEKGRPFIPPVKGEKFDKPIHRWAEEKRNADISECKYRLLVIRDPIERFLSAFNEKIFHKRWLKDHKFFKDKLLYADASSLPNINYFIENMGTFLNEYEYLNHHIKPATQFIGEIRLSFFTHIYPIENIQHLYEDVGRWTGAKAQLPHRNNSKIKKKQFTLADISEQNLLLLETFFKCDYELFENFYCSAQIWEKRDECKALQK